MQASQRLDRFGAEVFASLNNKLLALKAQGKTIYNMSVGTPDFKPYGPRGGGAHTSRPGSRDVEVRPARPARTQASRVRLL